LPQEKEGGRGEEIKEERGGGGGEREKKLKKYYATNSFKVVRNIPFESIRSSIDNLNAVPLIGKCKKIRKHKENATRFLIDVEKILLLPPPIEERDAATATAT